MFRLALMLVCLLIMLIVGIFGLLYNPKHPGMNTKRRLAALALCLAGAVQWYVIVLWH